MTYFSQNPISPPTPFGLTPPRNPREAADAIMAYLDREATGAAMPRTPFAPFLAETYAPPAVGDEGGYAPASSPFAETFATEPFGIEEEEPEALLPYPNAWTDDERIENVMWLLEKEPVDAAASIYPADEAITFDLEQLVDWADWTEAADTGRKLRSRKFSVLEAIVDLAVAKGFAAKTIREVYNYRIKRLSTLEPGNALLQKKREPNAALSLSDLDELRDEIAAAERRHTARGPLPPKSPGESEQAADGRGSHRFHKADTEAKGGEGNARIGNAGRADALFRNPRNGRMTAEELKRKGQRKRAEREAEDYAKEHERLKKEPTDWRGATYDPDELWERIRRDMKK